MNHARETRCIHGQAHRHGDAFRAVSYPIYQTAPFGHSAPGHNGSGFDYSRESNPTRAYLEETMTALEEGAVDTLAFSSGMAAVSACFELFRPGDHVICTDDLYGGVVRLIHTVCEKNGLTVDFVDTGAAKQIAAALRPNTRAIYLETPSNPMMHVSDIRACSALAHAQGALLIVDNTFLTPYFQNPFLLGADLVIHSGTKFLSGHNDTVCGFLCTSDAQLSARLRTVAKTTGAALSPFDSWLTLRGLKTLAVRMERHEQNARRLAAWLERQSFVKRVWYVGLESHPQYALNAAQSRGAGAMISFSVDSKETALRLLHGVKLITFAESLGGTESLLTYPALQTHPDVPQTVRDRLGITDRLLRLSAGLENADDLIADLSQAWEEHDAFRTV
ncbi:MAG: PLP-dependent transferase [Ruminococcaceae bacterium]|nr:PLP-dependent transferase [Oscillospiraceae bacterium]